jgi:hypothetical protein
LTYSQELTKKSGWFLGYLCASTEMVCCTACLHKNCSSEEESSKQLGKCIFLLFIFKVLLHDRDFEIFSAVVFTRTVLSLECAFVCKVMLISILNIIACP